MGPSKRPPTPRSSTRRPEPLTLASDGGTRREEVITGEADGMAATLVRLVPHSEVTLPTVGTTSGRACCILAGQLVLDGRPVHTRALGWSGPQDGDGHLV